MSLLAKLKAGINNIKTTVWPGTSEAIGIRILTEQEIQDAQFATEQLFKKHNIEFSSATVEAYNAEQTTQILARAIVDTETIKPLFKNVDELRGLLTHPEIKTALIDEYNSWQTDCSPALVTMTEEKYEALFAEVKKNGMMSPDHPTLSALSSKTLRGLIIYLADRQAKLAKVSGPTSP